MRPSSPAWLLLLVVLEASLLAGCLHKADPSPSPSPSITYYANYEGDWSLLNGTMQVYEITTKVEEWNGTAWQDHKPLPKKCPALSMYGYNATTRNLYLSADVALHPSDPGPLSAIWLNNISFGPKCNTFGFFGINENTFHRELPIVQEGAEAATARNVLSLDVTFERDNATPAVHSITIHGKTYAEGQRASLMWEEDNPKYPDRPFRARVHLEPVDMTFPISRVLRF